MGMDLDDLQALLGGALEDTGGGTGGVWIISAHGMLNDGLLRLIGKGRVVADALGGYVYLLKGCGAEGGDPQTAIRAGADRVLTAEGVPALADLAGFLADREPQVVLLPRDQHGRALGPGLAQQLRGGLVAYAADVAVDPIYQRVVAHQPVLDDAARQAIALHAEPAVIVVDTAMLPAAFDEPWRTGTVEVTGVVWPAAPAPVPADLERPALMLTTAPVIVAAGSGMKDEAGFALAERLAKALGGVIAGDLAALDAGWIDEDRLVGLTGHSVSPKLYLALGIDGDTSQFIATADAGCIVAVQPDASAPIVPVADYNILADPVDFAAALLAELGQLG
jgi:electron transfer flavoprotein alpha subunit